MPLSSSDGVGGQPGIITSTGMTLSTAPQLAYDTPNSPPSQAQLPAAITIFGDGVARQVRRNAVSMCRENNIDIVVCNLMKPGTVARVAQGDHDARLGGARAALRAADP